MEELDEDIFTNHTQEEKETNFEQPKNEHLETETKIDVKQEHNGTVKGQTESQSLKPKSILNKTVASTGFNRHQHSFDTDFCSD